MDTERERTDEARLVKRLDRADYLKAVELTQLDGVELRLRVLDVGRTPDAEQHGRDGDDAKERHWRQYLMSLSR